MLFFNKTCCLRIYEDYIYNYKLNYLTKFNSINNLASKNFNKITLNFGFKGIQFEKKKMVLFFMALELITNQKCVLTSSKKNLVFLRIKKGSITGCKVTLRKKNLYNFLDSLLLALPRSENFSGFIYKKDTNKQNNFSTKLGDLFIFQPLESELLPYVKFIDINFSFNTKNDFEKFFLFSHTKIPLIIK